MERLNKKGLVEIIPGVSVNEIDFKSLGAFKASFFYIAPNCASPVDFHAVKESWIVISGEGELSINEQSVGHIQAGDIVYFYPFDRHFVKNVLQEELKIISLWWD